MQPVKKLTSEKILQITHHEAFIWMLYSSLFNGDKFNSLDILQYWFSYAFGKELMEEDLTNNLIDKIRMGLLEKGGGIKPILKNTSLINKIKNNLLFE